MKQKRIVTMSRIFAILVVVAILGATLGAGSALAAKGGIAGKPGGGGNGGNGTTATMTVSPNPVPLGAPYEVRGSGFASGTTVYVGISNHCCAVPVATDGSGSFSIAVTQSGLSTPGTYKYVAMAYSHKSWVVAAEVTFEVT